MHLLQMERIQTWSRERREKYSDMFSYSDHIYCAQEDIWALLTYSTLNAYLNIS